MKPRSFLAVAFLVAALFGAGNPNRAQQPDPAIASQPARHSPEWLKSGTVEAAGNWKEIELPPSKPAPTAVSFISLNAFEARIFQPQSQ
jgi:hypothetical protein